MNKHLKKDLENRSDLLKAASEHAIDYLSNVEDRFVSPNLPTRPMQNLPDEGIGAKKTLELFKAEYAPYMQATNGPRFLGFVIGGNTPAALMGDWITSAYDQNAFGMQGKVDRVIEDEAIRFLCDMLNLPESFSGVFCSGATMANFTALAIAREWALSKQGKAPDDGLYGFDPPVFITGTAHASIYKALSMLGIGRKNMVHLPLLPGREAVDPIAVESYLQANPNKQIVVIANGGTVNSGDIDDIPALASLKEKYDFYLHIEGAIGAIAAVSPKYAPYFAGMEKADSVTIDAHKWLNTPYDGAAVLVNGKENHKHQFTVFAQQNSAENGYSEKAPFTNLAPEGSRRLRALPAWFSLIAYGKQGYIDITEQNCKLAKQMEGIINSCPKLKVVHEVRLNVASFTLNKKNVTMEEINNLATKINETGVTFLNTATVLGVPVIRVCVSNYQTTEEDIVTVGETILKIAECL